MNNYTQIGTFLHTRGVHGQLVTQLELSIQSLDPITFIFIQIIGNTYVPYQVEDRRLVEPDYAWLTLQDVNTKEAAKSLLGKAIWLPSEDLQQLTSTSSIFPQQLISYEVEDLHIGRLGTVMQIEKLPQQHCLAVAYHQQSLLIPYVSAFIKEIDHPRKHITSCLPGGFIEAMGITPMPSS